MAAKDIQTLNNVRMAISERSSLFFPVTKIDHKEGKIVCEIHNQSFTFEPEQMVEVQDVSLKSYQKQAIYKIGNIEGTVLSCPKGFSKRTYQAFRLGTKEAIPEELTFTRDTRLKIFTIDNWPNWMPPLNDDMKHYLSFAKTWGILGKALHALTGGNVI